MSQDRVGKKGGMEEGEGWEEEEEREEEDEELT